MEENIDASNKYIATKWDQFNRSVDTFFTNKISHAGDNKSSIFAYTSFYSKEGQGIQTEFDFQLKLDLPNTTKKLKIIIEKQQDEISNALNDNSIANNRSSSKEGKNQRKKETHYTAGVNYLLSRSEYFVTFVHFGIRLDMPLNPSLKVDLQKNFETSLINIGLSQKVIIYRQEGLQEVSQLTLNKKVNETIQTDLVNSLVWTDETDLLVLRNNFIVSQDLGNEKGLYYSIGANARFSPKFYYDSYDASISYRQLLHKDWLYGTLTLGADFPKVSNFDDEKFVQFRIDMYFKK